MSDLEKETVVPATNDTPALSEAEIGTLLAELGADWSVTNHVLTRRYGFPDFARALAFVNGVGALAEEVQHHPDVMLGWGRVELSWTTHDIGGLARADFIMAARSDRLFADEGHA